MHMPDADTSDSPPDVLRMANQIAAFFAPYPEADAVAGVLDHIEKFWAPSQRKELLAQLAATEAPLQEFEAGREMLDAIEADPAGWAAMRARLTDGPFVDMQKLFIGEGRKAA